MSRQTRVAYGFLAPGLLLFAVYRLYPLLEGLRLSFTNARLGRPTQQWIGLANYARLLEDTRFQVSLWNTAFYTVASTLPILAVPLVLALALNRGRLKNLLRSVFFFPFTLSVVTVGLAWLWLLDPVVGPFNYYLRALGAPAWEAMLRTPTVVVAQSPMPFEWPDAERWVVPLRRAAFVAREITSSFRPSLLAWREASRPTRRRTGIRYGRPMADTSCSGGSANATRHPTVTSIGMSRQFPAAHRYPQALVAQCSGNDSRPSKAFLCPMRGRARVTESCFTAR